ncbi:ABC transporter permease [Alkaliphilus oremlandii]|uniref:Inner-membrane translocator n=1 Tax=Alkaliphilus oremlandii (strain OhILAs) TaxID=350688 RepID=A8MJC8_ALKOO|nr:ABC transporter permease [Alkaliphilus oremlandii]ABW19910.1 inner-membrane translocator [Alkaliphilus oremlandii OhILAs]
MKKLNIKIDGEYILSITGSILLALLLGAVIMVLNGKNPILGYGALITGAFGNKYAIATTLTKTVPLILTGLATAIAFMSGIFNIGGEGQLYLGAFAATYIGFTFKGLPAGIGIILAVLCSAVVGAALAYIPAILKVKFKIDEVIVCVMLNSIAMLFTGYLVNYPFKATDGSMGGSNLIADQYRFTRLVQVAKLNTSIIYAAMIAILIYYLVKKTSYGYNFRMIGENNVFSKYMGLSTEKYMIVAMLISGALCGVAGAFEVYGMHYRFLTNLSKGYAFDGMLISLIVKNSPVGIVIMSIFFAALKTGSVVMELETGISSELVAVIQALIILFMAGESGFKALFRRKKLSKKEA